jgi:tetratricopeptide (TPR) repeat protein
MRAPLPGWTPLALLLALATLACDGVRRGRELLERNRPAEALAAPRPASAAAFVVRARALRRLGRLDRARTELLLALSLDGRSAEAHNLLGLVEAQLGNRGAALSSLERAVRLEPGRVCARRELSRLLLWRAFYRLQIGQRDEAREELERVRELNPCLAPRVAAMLRLVEQRRRPGDVGGVRGCPGVPALRAARPPRRGPCELELPARLVRALERRELLLGCRGAQLALRLEARGCVAAARSVWEALAREGPSDPRWPLQVARALIVEGQPGRVEPLLTSHVFLSEDRADGLLGAARMLEAVGRRRSAARRAVEALPHARRLSQQLESLRILRRIGSPDQIRQAARVVEERGWDLPRPRLRRLIHAAIGARRTPRQ